MNKNSFWDRVKDLGSTCLGFHSIETSSLPNWELVWENPRQNAPLPQQARPRRQHQMAYSFPGENNFNF